MTDTIFIGYDAREHEAACVAAYSITRRANNRTRVYILEHMALRRLGLFDRPYCVDETGQFQDQRDGRPFSTAFSHSRFLVFELAHALKCAGPCMFVDCDWLFLDDPGTLFRDQENNGTKIGVVNRDRVVDENSIKMDGMVQQNYHRKLWSALFTFMPTKNLATTFTSAQINHRSGRDLHGFLDKDPTQFWDIDPKWHYIPSLDEKMEQPAGIHFSEFSPWINPERYKDYPDTFDYWTWEKEAWLNHAAVHKGALPWRDLELDLKAARA